MNFHVKSALYGNISKGFSIFYFEIQSPKQDTTSLGECVLDGLPQKHLLTCYVNKNEGILIYVCPELLGSRRHHDLSYGSSKLY